MAKAGAVVAAANRNGFKTFWPAAKISKIIASDALQAARRLALMGHPRPQTLYIPTRPGRVFVLISAGFQALALTKYGFYAIEIT
jgi:hypothetical protein